MPRSLPPSCTATASSRTVKRWDIFEIELSGPSTGAPFTDVTLRARFEQGDTSFEPHGFYDGDGTYGIRFMPDRLGEWTYTTHSNAEELDGLTGAFTCVAAAENVHGPVGVRDSYHFAHADGAPHYSVGTTCYAWTHQDDAREEQTLATLRDSPFNKVRMCVFPKSYTYNQNEPERYPFEGTPPRDWDFTRFSPAFFRHFERRVGQLRDLGIEADIILIHPYDRWGFKQMEPDADDRYLRYVVARLAAYRNVWWSMANEFDFVDGHLRGELAKSSTKGMDAWDRFFQIVQQHDPYDHLRSIHNGRVWYDHTKPWVTHVSIQDGDLGNAAELREKYGKPLVYDECRYEGDIPPSWGNITAKHMVHQFWIGAATGGYVGHGETYEHPEDLLWWAKGGVLRGESPARIAFLNGVIAEAPTFAELEPSVLSDEAHLLSKPGEYYLLYTTDSRPVEFDLAGGKSYKVDAIDTWSMTTTSLGSADAGRYRFTPPHEPTALRFTPYAADEARRPQAHAEAAPTSGVVPLTVEFATSSADRDLSIAWDFGDGTASIRSAPTHTYTEPGLYTATATVTDDTGLSTTIFLPVTVDRRVDDPIVRIGTAQASTHPLTFRGTVEAREDGAHYLADGKPWKRLIVGEGTIADLERLRSFTVTGWLRPDTLDVGGGGNRIVFNLSGNRSGIDLVHLADGRMRLAVNQLADDSQTDSSPGRLSAGEWTFFAVTYEADANEGAVRWHFGGIDDPAEFDRSVTYSRGALRRHAGRLAIGNYNRTMQGAEYDRQFRGSLRAIQIHGSRVGSGGALPLLTIRRLQDGS
jgi:PKD repeat protein